MSNIYEVDGVLVTNHGAFRSIVIISYYEKYRLGLPGEATNITGEFYLKQIDYSNA